MISVITITYKHRCSSPRSEILISIVDYLTSVMHTAPTHPKQAKNTLVPIQHFLQAVSGMYHTLLALKHCNLDFANYQALLQRFVDIFVYT